MTPDVARLIEHSRASLGDPGEWPEPDGYPSSLALCLLDSIWSLGANYTAHVIPVINRYRARRAEEGANADRDCARDLVDYISRVGGPVALAEVLSNHQRTSARHSAPTKAEAVQEAAVLMDGATVQTPAQLVEAASQLDLKRAWRRIPGQRSSTIGWTYLLMLAGHPGVKADRMICRFVQGALGLEEVSPARAEELVTAAAAELGVELRTYDWVIWNHQRSSQR